MDGEYIIQKDFMTSGQNSSQYSSFRSKLQVGKQSIGKIAEINIKAGLEINKIGRWQKYKGEILGKLDRFKN